MCIPLLTVKANDDSLTQEERCPHDHIPKGPFSTVIKNEVENHWKRKRKSSGMPLSTYVNSVYSASESRYFQSVFLQLKLEVRLTSLAPAEFMASYGTSVHVSWIPFAMPSLLE